MPLMHDSLWGLSGNLCKLWRPSSDNWVEIDNTAHTHQCHFKTTLYTLRLVQVVTGYPVRYILQLPKIPIQLEIVSVNLCINVRCCLMIW